jgi:hypothetical protein
VVQSVHSGNETLGSADPVHHRVGRILAVREPEAALCKKCVGVEQFRPRPSEFIPL